MTNEERAALVGAMKDQIESWEFEELREDWWKWQHQYARAADQIEAQAKRIAELEEALRNIGNFARGGGMPIYTPAGMWVGTPDAYAREVMGDEMTPARAALAETFTERE